MHGGGTVSGLQLVAAMSLKTCCAYAGVGQRNHHQGHHGHRTISITSSRIRRHQGRSSGMSGRGNRRGGPPGPGSKKRTSTMLWASSSVRMIGCAETSASRS